MRLGMAQISLSTDMDANEQKILSMIQEAGSKDVDYLFFPELMYSPFFPQYRRAELKDKIGKDVEEYLMDKNDIRIAKLARAAWNNRVGISPNFYMKDGDACYDASLFISQGGVIECIAKMVNICQAPMFYEQDYYTPSDDGYKVCETEYGHVGIIICYDRHLEESFKACKEQGADIVIIPTANCKAEPMEAFEREVCDAAKKYGMYVAMCNRVGLEGEMDFAGESIVVGKDGQVLFKADDQEQFIVVDLD